jgi:hypothetical protein
MEVYHDWTPIPTTTTPTHWMLNGHSFVVVVHDDVRSGAAGSSTDQGVPIRTSQTTVNVHKKMQKKAALVMTRHCPSTNFKESMSLALKGARITALSTGIPTTPSSSRSCVQLDFHETEQSDITTFKCH